MRFLNTDPSSNADFLVTIDQLPESYIVRVSGGEKTVTRAKYVDGLSNRERTARSGKIMVSDVTIEKPFDPESTSDIALIEWAEEKLATGEFFNMMARPCIRNKEVDFRGSKAFRFSNCMVMGLNAPGDIDVGDGSTVSMIRITLAPEDKVYAGA